MEEQGKRLLLAVALIMGVLFVWQSFFHPKEDDPQKQQQQAAQKAAKQAAAKQAAAAAGSLVPAAPGERGPEQKISLSFPNVVATFSNYGGTLSSWKLTDKRYEHDVTKGELLPDPVKQ